MSLFVQRPDSDPEPLDNHHSIWYGAGLENQHSVSMLDDAPPQTDDLRKQDFESMMSEDADRTDVLQEIPKHFDGRRARYKNDSFGHFCSTVLD